MTGNAWVHVGPDLTEPRTGETVPQGQPIEITALAGDWAHVVWFVLGEGEAHGWVQARWVGAAGVVPETLITPMPTP